MAVRCHDEICFAIALCEMRYNHTDPYGCIELRLSRSLVLQIKMALIKELRRPLTFTAQAFKHADPSVSSRSSSASSSHSPTSLGSCPLLCIASRLTPSALIASVLVATYSHNLSSWFLFTLLSSRCFRCFVGGSVVMVLLRFCRRALLALLLSWLFSLAGASVV